MRTNKGVRGIIIKNGEILLIHRFKQGDVYWVVPGGGVEEGETLEEALRREMKEETGLDVVEFKLLDQINIDKTEHYYYECTVAEGEAKLGGPEAEANCSDNQYILTWLPVSEAKKLDALYPGDVRKLL